MSFSRPCDPRRETADVRIVVRLELPSPKLLSDVPVEPASCPTVRRVGGQPFGRIVAGKVHAVVAKEHSQPVGRVGVCLPLSHAAGAMLTSRHLSLYRKERSAAMRLASCAGSPTDSRSTSDAGTTAQPVATDP
jgi:hypothetical protein